MIKIYVYRKDTGVYKYEDIGSYEGVIHDLGDGLDFTLVPYPLDGNRYKWNGSEWEKLPEDMSIPNNEETQ